MGTMPSLFGEVSTEAPAYRPPAPTTYFEPVEAPEVPHAPLDDAES
jgi:hypothetical protein